ncbi:O-methyltransferase [Parageobacillus thermoglucosidasius]|uniref:O-methyltransferase n=1 Tax=Parageobacillus thermoglucosidasius TaxID=1426 RepID=UPI000B555CA3|nr:O-methyltransferase [Parageobacillus thermoglucosidasius]MBY6267840.1 SAM-dependent methyltransferase [Parageobacillus thermoglucosidasius]MED4905048.1 O-methyltransferase [Parageobacillus thermoglucosidasius]MED4913273.1 O-methyltransferase [Parageobacillus thermoglucosidasius]MED4944687.1 O-methyltransferase [Parageobacillus thermoglucosidasius]MED4982379.1 O-methyltransferase [Parageobacillus thermoglucosidasius]
MISKEVAHYMEQFLPERDEPIKEMERYAKQHRIPIMEIAGIEAMLQLLKIAKPKKILEIGTAIGYSAIRMAKALPDANIVTIERDRERYERALFYINKTGTGGQIRAIFGDALDVYDDVAEHAPFDVIFIDAAKGQYQRFFQMYEPLLQEGGIIITDNVLFKGLVAMEEPIENKRIRQLVSKIRRYNEWLFGQTDYETVILPIGDGIAISRKRGEKR